MASGCYSFDLNSEAVTRGKTAAGSGFGAARRGVAPAIDFPSTASSSVPIPEPTDDLDNESQASARTGRSKGKRGGRAGKGKGKKGAGASPSKPAKRAAGNNATRSNTVVDKRFNNGPPVGLLGNSGRGNVCLSVGGPKKSTMLNL